MTDGPGSLELPEPGPGSHCNVRDVGVLWQNSYHIDYGEHRSTLHGQTAIYEDSGAQELGGTAPLGLEKLILDQSSLQDQAVHQGSQLLFQPLPTALPGCWLGLLHSVYPFSRASPWKGAGTGLL